MTTSGLPFDDIRNLLNNLPPMVGPSVQSAVGANRVPGRIGEILDLLARCAGRPVVRIARPQLALFVGTHSLGDAGSANHKAYQVKRRIERLAAGDDALNKLCLAADLGFKVYDLALDVPVADITAGPALDERDCAATMAFGMEAVGGTDLLCISALDTDDGRSARAILGALGKGFDDEAVPACHSGRITDPLEVLRRLGGRETAAVAGALLAARVQKVPVIIDGASALAAAAVLHSLEPGSVGHCIVADAGHDRLAQTARDIGLPGLLAFEATEGQGAALAAGVLKASVEAYA